MSHRRSFSLGFLLFGATQGAVVGCAKGCGATADGASTADTDVAAASGSSAPVGPVGSAGSTGRCVTLGRPVRVGAPAVAVDPASPADEGPIAFGAEIGAAIADARGFIVGVRASGERGAPMLVRVPLDGASSASDLATIATLATRSAFSHARPPFFAASRVRGLGDAPFVVGVLENEGGVRELRVFSVDPERSPSTVAWVGSVLQDDDESEVSALYERPGGALAAWDEGDPTHRYGEIHVRSAVEQPVVPDASAPPATGTSASSSARAASGARAAASGRASASAVRADVVSPPTSDASAPAIVAFGDGSRAIVLWLAEHPDTEGDAERATDGGAGEPAQEESNRWIEAEIVDVRSGNAIGAPRALTSEKAHAQTFSVALSTAGDALFIALRDDARPADGDGGSLSAIRVPLAADGALGGAIDIARVKIADDDVAPGMPRLITRPTGAWVAYLTAAEETRIVPIFQGGEAKPTLEPALAGRSVVASRDDRVLGARIAGAAVELVVVKCRD